jgi:hypothetical protein
MYIYDRKGRKTVTKTHKIQKLTDAHKSEKVSPTGKITKIFMKQSLP